MELENQVIVAATIEATKEVVPEVYKDGLQPTVQEVGKNLHTVSKLITVALAPVSALVWGYEKIAEHLKTSLTKKLENIPRENITTPDPSVAVPAIEALRYTGHKEELREMFSSLIATAMDKTTAPKAHPSFVEIIKQLSPDEAKIMRSLDHNGLQPLLTVKAVSKETQGFVEIKKNYSDIPIIVGCIYPELGSSYIENLNRLGLISIDSQIHLIDDSYYDNLISKPEIQTFVQHITNDLDRIVEYKKHSFTRTEFGEKFFSACIML